MAKHYDDLCTALADRLLDRGYPKSWLSIPRWSAEERQRRLLQLDARTTAGVGKKYDLKQSVLTMVIPWSDVNVRLRLISAFTNLKKYLEPFIDEKQKEALEGPIRVAWTMSANAFLLLYRQNFCGQRPRLREMRDLSLIKDPVCT